MRLFIALPLPQEVETKLGELTTEFKERGGRVRWVRPANIHLTVRFLGDTEEDRVPKIVELIDKVAGDFPAVDVLLDRLGGFPNLKRPRVLWVGLREDEQVHELSKLARQVELGVRRLRFEKEKKGFKPHLTLGRVKDSRGCRDLTEYMEQYTFEPLPVHLDRLVLFQSTLTPKGSVYKRLHEAMLGKERFGG